VAALTEDPRHLLHFDEEAQAEIFRRAGLHQSSQASQDTSNSAGGHLPFCLLQWCRGETESIIRRTKFFGAVSSTIIGKHPTRKEISSVDELGNYSGWDLGIL